MLWRVSLVSRSFKGIADQLYRGSPGKNFDRRCEELRASILSCPYSEDGRDEDKKMKGSERSVDSLTVMVLQSSDWR